MISPPFFDLGTERGSRAFKTNAPAIYERIQEFMFWRTRTLTPVHTSARVNDQLLC